MGDRSWSLQACEQALGTELSGTLEPARLISQTGLAVQAEQEGEQEDSRRVEPLGASEEPSLKVPFISHYCPASVENSGSNAKTPEQSEECMFIRKTTSYP